MGLSAAALALYFVENEEFRIVTNALNKLIRVPGGSSGVLVPSAEETPPVH